MTKWIHPMEASLQAAWARRDPTPAEIELQNLPERIPLGIYLIHGGTIKLVWLHEGGARQLAEERGLSHQCFRTHDFVRAIYDFTVTALQRQRQVGSKLVPLFELLLGTSPMESGHAALAECHFATLLPEAIEGLVQWIPRLDAVMPTVEWETVRSGGKWPIVQSLLARPVPFLGIRGCGGDNTDDDDWVLPNPSTCLSTREED